MSWDAIGDTACPIARSLSVIGDRWTLLILRELAMGSRRFEDFQAQTGMSSALLTSRLKRLEADGVIARRKSSGRPTGHDYVVTEKGRDLDPLLMMLRSWGTRWGGFASKDEPATHMVDRNSGVVLDPHRRVPQIDVDFTLSDVDSSFSPAFAAERAARKAAFLSRSRRRKAIGTDREDSDHI